MHSAPAVSYPVGPSFGARAVLSSLWLLGAVCAGGAVAQSGIAGFRPLVLLASVAVAGWVAWRFGGHRQTGRLRFDGQDWSWSGAGALGAARAEVALDLQVLLLVRLSEPGRSRRWLWIERRADRVRWPDLRRAVYSRAPMAPPADAPAPAPDVPASFR